MIANDVAGATGCAFICAQNALLCMLSRQNLYPSRALFDSCAYIYSADACRKLLTGVVGRRLPQPILVVIIEGRKTAGSLLRQNNEREACDFIDDRTTFGGEPLRKPYVNLDDNWRFCVIERDELIFIAANDASRTSTISASRYLRSIDGNGAEATFLTGYEQR